MNKIALSICLAALTLTLDGCGSLTGTGGSDKLACKAPDGVACSSLSGVYANALANNLPGLQKGQHATKTEAIATKDGKAYLPHSTSITGEAPTSGEPILTKAHVMRIWVAPWEDSEGDLHDQSYIYVVANSGRWAIEHNEKQIMNRYQPTFLKQPAQGSTQSEPGSVEKKVNVNGNNALMLPNAQGFQAGNSAKTPDQ